MQRIVTDDKARLHHYDPETKQQSNKVCSGSMPAEFSKPSEVQAV